MKPFLTIIILCGIIQSVNSQSNSDYYMWPYGKNDKIEFTETIYLPKSNTDSLFSLSISFLKNKFNTERDSISTNGKKRTAYCKGVFYLPIPQLGEKGNGYIGFMLSISAYNKSYRYSFTNFEHFSQNPNGLSGGPLENDRPAVTGKPFPLRYWNEEKARAYCNIQATIESLKEYMAKHTVE